MCLGVSETLITKQHCKSPQSLINKGSAQTLAGGHQHELNPDDSVSSGFIGSGICVWPSFCSDRAPADQALVGANHNPLSNTGRVWYDDCTNRPPTGVPLRNVHTQPRWLPLCHPFVALIGCQSKTNGAQGHFGQRPVDKIPSSMNWLITNNNNNTKTLWWIGPATLE